MGTVISLMLLLQLAFPTHRSQYTSGGGGGFAHCVALTVQSSQVGSGGVTNYPLAVSGTYAHLATTGNGGYATNANGYDIGFYGDSACSTTKLAWETELYTATNGKVVYWVKVPSVSSSSNTTIYVGIGNSGITTDQSNHTAVWDSNFLGVYHLPNGTTLGTNDSTSNARNGSITGSVSAVAGQIDGAATFGGGSSDTINLGTAASISTTTPFTIEFWFNITNFSPGAFAGLMSLSDGSSTGYQIFASTSGSYTGLDFGSSGSTPTWVTVSTLNSGVPTAGWHQFVLNYNGSSPTTATNFANYVDNVFEGGNAPGNFGTAYTFTGIGAGTFLGSIDEVRISNIVRSVAWNTTVYNNESSPSTFYTFTP